MSRRMITLLTVGLILIGIIGSVTYSRASGTEESDAVKQAKALKASLSPEQQQAISAIIAKYQSELATIASQLPDISAMNKKVYLPSVITSSASGSAKTTNIAPLTDTNKGQRISQKAALDLQGMQNKIDAEIVAVLTPDQLKQYRVAMPSIPSATVGNVQSISPATSSTPQSNSVCGLAASYASVARAEAIQAEANALINYLDLPNGTNTVASELAFANLNIAQTFSLAGLKELSGSYIDYVVFGNDFNGLGRAGYDSEVSTKNYALIGFGYANSEAFAYFAYYAARYAAYAADDSNTAASLAPNCF